MLLQTTAFSINNGTEKMDVIVNGGDASTTLTRPDGNNRSSINTK